MPALSILILVLPGLTQAMTASAHGNFQMSLRFIRYMTLLPIKQGKNG